MYYLKVDLSKYEKNSEIKYSGARVPKELIIYVYATLTWVLDGTLIQMSLTKKRKSQSQ